MSVWIQPVFDRTIEDVDFARAHRNDDQLYKGAQSYVAWNRLVGNMHHLADILNGYGYQVSLESRVFGDYTVGEWNALKQTVQEIESRGKTARDFFANIDVGRWGLGDIPFNHEIDLIREDLGRLRYALHSLMNYSVAEWDSFGQTVEEIDGRGLTAQEYFSKLPIPPLPYTHFQKINDVEEITFSLHEIIESIKQLYRVSGTFQSGQLSYLPHFLDVEIEYMTVQEFNDLGRTVAQIEAEGRTAATFFRRL